jgi:thiamine pyrophosphokinase
VSDPEGAPIRDPGPDVGRRAIVVADGSVPGRAALDATWPGWADGVSIVVAADGGARGALALGLSIDLWVGDADSLGEEELARLARSGVPIERSPTDKDESDAELAILAAGRLGSTDLTVLGALGGPRLDHAIANIGLLAHRSLTGRRARLLDIAARVALYTAPTAAGDPVEVDLGGRVGDTVSLLPFGGDVVGVTTTGLRYPLDDEDLVAGQARGLSNIRVEDAARLSLRAGRLLVVETPATLRP